LTFSFYIPYIKLRTGGNTLVTLIVITLAAHVLSSVFWAGSTFALARLSGLGGERLVLPQAGAAVVAILTGAYLWHAMHGGGFGTFEQVLVGGIAAALTAILLQASLGFGALAALRRERLDDGSAQRRIAMAQRFAAGLLAITVVCMAIARYV
jgi:hypothetical protein